MSTWEVDARLAGDSIYIGEQGLIQIRAMPAAPWPWLILVPRIPGAVELFDLSEGDQQALFQLSMALAARLKSEFAADKINIGAIGNVVSQLHVHIVARHRHDRAWPAPVWGQAFEPADSRSQAERVRRLTRLLG